MRYLRRWTFPKWIGIFGFKVWRLMFWFVCLFIYKIASIKINLIINTVRHIGTHVRKVIAQKGATLIPLRNIVFWCLEQFWIALSWILMVGHFWWAEIFGQKQTCMVNQVWKHLSGFASTFVGQLLDNAFLPLVDGTTRVYGVIGDVVRGTSTLVDIFRVCQQVPNAGVTIISGQLHLMNHTLYMA